MNKAKNLLSKAVSHLDEQLVISHGKGSYVYSNDGRKLLDLACGIGVTNLGHCHPKVIAAAKLQVDKIIHAQMNMGYHEPMLKLMDSFRQIVSKSCEKFMFVNSGAEAVENAVKMCRYVTGRQNIICFRGGYHGRTAATMALTSSDTVYKAGFGPLMPGVHVAEYPYTRHFSDRLKPDDVSDQCIRQFEMLLSQQVNPFDVAAVLIEPILGEGGYVPLTQKFASFLQSVCREHRIPLIVDEVQTGFGRTGEYFACQHQSIGLEPDLMIMAKGIASGFPLSAVGGRSSLIDLDVNCPTFGHRNAKGNMQQVQGRLGGTYGGNAVACAAAVATIDVLINDQIMKNVRERANQFRRGLQELKRKYTQIQDIRGLGLMIGVEFDPTCDGIAKRISQTAIKHDLLLLKCSTFQTIRIIPPLNISAEEVEEALHKLDLTIFGALRA
ncbi:hypothetical protein MIR68_011264 [Amoeboaphelidium protococcarum]|nr:hypothetical protein MIR68_011264 [Amoeboaphelidium protococcarum]